MTETKPDEVAQEAEAPNEEDRKAAREEAVEEARSSLGAAHSSESNSAETPGLEEKRIKKFWKSVRYRRAKDYITKDNGWTAYIPNVEMMIKPEPSDYKHDDYRGEIDCYTAFKHTFMVDYEFDATVLNWREWRDHADINTNVIEQKFPIDLTVRDIITAYRLILGRNQWRHIRTKRLFQLLATLVLLAGLAALLHWDASAMLAPVLPSSLLAFAPTLSFLPFVILIGLFSRWMTWDITKMFNAKMQAASGRLSTAMNRKTSGILTAFKQTCNDAGTIKVQYSPEEKVWIDDAIWLTRVALWLPKRVDYIDRFFQLEMQNIRFLRNRSDILGNLWAMGVFAVGLAGVFAVVSFYGWQGPMAMLQGSNLPETGLILTSLAALTVLNFISTSFKHSIKNSDIKGWIGEQTWVNFSDFDMFREVSEIIRVYAYHSFVEDNKGSTRAS
jgi:hypothetical protein